MMHTLLIRSKNAPAYRQLLQDASLPALEIVDKPSPQVEIVFGEPNLILEILPQLPGLRWVQSTWAGVEPLLNPTLRRDYTLTNARGVFGGLMAEFVFGYLLLHERKILQRLEAQKQHRWEATLPGTLRGKTLGLLGVGSIGAELARTAKFFGMTVRGYTRSSRDCAHVDQYFHPPALLDFAAGVDFLVSVLPNTAETQKVITARLLAALPPSALVMNVGRGSAVDESALVKALQTGAIAGAVLDVFEQEPLPAENPLWETPNLFITSHTSAPSFPAELAQVFIENYQRYYTNQPLLYQVNFERGY